MGKFYSDDLEKGIHLLYFQDDTSKYEEAVRLIQRACDKQEPDAFYIMARCYAWGDGKVEGDEDKAISYSQKGIELGSDLCVLGADRFDELEKMKPYMTKTLEKSLEAVRQRAEAGDAVSQYAVGLFYYWGDALGIQTWNSKEDLERLEVLNGAESSKWYKMAAEQGHISAFCNLYISIFKGQYGVKKDKNLAFSHAENLKSKVKIPKEMCYSIACDYEDENNYKKAGEWLELGVSKGCPKCMNSLGLAYLGGKGVPEDDNKAIELFQEGHMKQHSYSTHNLGRCHLYGWGCEKDYKKAHELFLIASEKGVANSYRCLAEMYENGWYVEEDYENAVKYYRIAADEGSKDAIDDLKRFRKTLFGKWKRIKARK